MNWWEGLDGPILGRYRIDRLLGEGDMARVFLATDVRAQRPVALKTPKIESLPPDPVKELLARFNREFRSQANISCSSLEPTPGEASVPVDAIMARYLDKERAEFTAARAMSGRWTVRDAPTGAGG